MLKKAKKISFSWRHRSVCTLIDHGKQPITARVVFTSLYNLHLSPFDTARLLNLLSPILDRSHVFRRRTDENERSPVALVVGFTVSSLQIVCAYWISFFSGSGNFTPPTRSISSKHDIFSSFNITSKILSCPGRVLVSTSSLYDASRNWTLPHWAIVEEIDEAWIRANFCELLLC